MPAQGKRRTRRKSDLDREFEKLLRRAVALAKARRPRRASRRTRRLTVPGSPAGLPKRNHPERLAGSATKDPSASLHLGQDTPSFAKLAGSAPGWCNW